MHVWLIVLSYLFTSTGNSLADLDLFTGELTADIDESLFQYNNIDTEPTPTLLAWDLDDAILPPEEALLADTLDYAHACASESTEPAVRLRARGAQCPADEAEAVKKPPRKKNNPNWFVGSYEVNAADLAITMEDFTCHNQGYTYAVCDSGDLADVARMFAGQYCSLSHCDLCMFLGESLFYLRSGTDAESKIPAEAPAHSVNKVSQCTKLPASVSAHGSSGVAWNSCDFRPSLPWPVFAQDTFLFRCRVIGSKFFNSGTYAISDQLRSQLHWTAVFAGNQAWIIAGLHQSGFTGPEYLYRISAHNKDLSVHGAGYES